MRTDTIESALADIRAMGERASQHVRDGADDELRRQAKAVLAECEVLRESLLCLTIPIRRRKAVLAEIEAHEDSANTCLAALGKRTLQRVARLGVCSEAGT